jgi:geranylgeranyl pyrophosphate synthase
MFRLLVRLMSGESTQGNRADFSHLCRLIGRYFQIRDDYQNIVSEEVCFTNPNIHGRC